jgi:hypothetical protein
VSQVPCSQRHQRTAHQAGAGILDLIPENAAQTHHGVGEQIVQQAHEDGLEDHGVVAEIAGLKGGAHGLRPQCHFQQRVAEAGNEAPLHAIAVGDQHHREHGHQRHLTAEGHFGDDGLGDQLQHNGQRQQHGAFRQSFGFHFGNLQKNKYRIANRPGATRY